MLKVVDPQEGVTVTGVFYNPTLSDEYYPNKRLSNMSTSLIALACPGGKVDELLGYSPQKELPSSLYNYLDYQSRYGYATALFSNWQFTRRTETGSTFNPVWHTSTRGSDLHIGRLPVKLTTDFQDVLLKVYGDTPDLTFQLEQYAFPIIPENIRSVIAEAPYWYVGGPFSWVKPDGLVKRDVASLRLAASSVRVCVSLYIRLHFLYTLG
jgi:hypothetical protein